MRDVDDLLSEYLRSRPGDAVAGHRLQLLDGRIDAGSAPGLGDAEGSMVFGELKYVGPVDLDQLPQG